MRKLRVIVVGVGHLGRVHAQILAKLPGVRLMGVVDPCEGARHTVAEACRTNAFADVAALEGKFDAAVVAAPTCYHRRLGLELLEQGIPCLIEKPLATNSAEADEIVRAARRQGVVLQVGHVERFNPALAPTLPYARDPKFIEATRAGGFTGRSTDIGVVMDLMIHDIDIVLSVVGASPVDVEALGLAVLGPHEDVAHARLTFAGGCVALLNASRVSPASSRRMQIWSQEGLVNVDFAAKRSSAIIPGDAVRERRIDVPHLPPQQKDELKRDLFADYLKVEEFAVEPCDQLTAELQDFVQCVQEGRQPRVTGEQGREAIAVAERVLEKIAAHAWDGTSQGRIGPLAAPQPDVIPSPHWRTRSVMPLERKEAV
jgi:predicted dehydrogenase